MEADKTKRPWTREPMPPKLNASDQEWARWEGQKRADAQLNALSHRMAEAILAFDEVPFRSSMGGATFRALQELAAEIRSIGVDDD